MSEYGIQSIRPGNISIQSPPQNGPEYSANRARMGEAISSIKKDTLSLVYDEIKRRARDNWNEDVQAEMFSLMSWIDSVQKCL